MASSSGAFTGPMAVISWVVSAGWVALAVFALTAAPAPTGWVIGGAAVAGALGTGWLARSLRVPYDETGLRLPRRGHVRWDQVDAVDLAPGLVCMPVITMHAGRLVEEVPLDGLGWFGGTNGLARRLAEKVAREAGLDAVGVRGDDRDLPGA
ncbi:MAG: hypothetical protein QM708_04730 [Propioniciclava sp.]|uniref:hypothetical protein n=1 Tax=Propioniciclava sp. TaxID=2038686 RepID=UPI0039E38889